MKNATMPRAVLACGLLLFTRAAASGGDVVAVLSSDSPHYSAAFEGFQEAWGTPVSRLLLGDGEVMPRTRVVVAFGSQAALQDWAPHIQLVACLAPAARVGRQGGILIVDLLPSAPALLARIQAVLPRVRTLRLLWTSRAQRDSVEELMLAGEAIGMKVLAERVPSDEALPSVLRSLDAKVDAVLLMPDPVLVNATSFAVLREFSKAARIPFLAPMEGLAEKGATAPFADPPVREARFLEARAGDPRRAR